VIRRVPLSVAIPRRIRIGLTSERTK
jgi:hypothetical protein